MSTTTTYAARGLTCEHCVKAVTDELAKLASVREVRVGLVASGNSSIQVTSDGSLDDALVRDAVAEAGYELLGVQ